MRSGSGAIHARETIKEEPTPFLGTYTASVDGMNASAFLAAYRMLHERLDLCIQLACQGLKIRSMEPIATSELVSLFEELGMVHAVPEEVNSFVQTFLRQKSKSSELPDSLLYYQVYQVVFEYCQSDGFTETDNQDLAVAFNSFDDDKSGTLGADEIGPIIRWLGYQPTHYKIYDFAEEVGLRTDSEFDLREFRSIISKYKLLTLRSARELFFDSDGNERKIPGERIGEALAIVGFELSSAEHSNCLRMVEKHAERTGCTSMSFRDFKRYEAAHRKAVRELMTQNRGFSDAEYKRHQKFFDESASNGFMSQKSVRNLLATMFPDKGLSKGWHAKIAQMVKDADEDGNGLFEWHEFLTLMKGSTQELEKDLLMKGLHLKEELGYQGTELKQFRELYKACDTDGSGDVDFQELCTILENLVPMDAQATRELEQVVNSVDDGGGTLDFWEFLRLMKKLQDKNWRNINGVAEGHAGRRASNS
jgi:Ca2+-binding EF-hand superfamily protein